MYRLCRANAQPARLAADDPIKSLSIGYLERLNKFGLRPAGQQRESGGQRGLEGWSCSLLASPSAVGELPRIGRVKIDASTLEVGSRLSELWPSQLDKIEGQFGSYLNKEADQMLQRGWLAATGTVRQQLAAGTMNPSSAAAFLADQIKRLADLAQVYRARASRTKNSWWERRCSAFLADKRFNTSKKSLEGFREARPSLPAFAVRLITLGALLYHYLARLDPIAGLPRDSAVRALYDQLTADMGGRPTVGWPIDWLPADVATDLITGRISPLYATVVALAAMAILLAALPVAVGPGATLIERLALLNVIQLRLAGILFENYAVLLKQLAEMLEIKRGQLDDYNATLRQRAEEMRQLQLPDQYEVDGLEARIVPTSSLTIAHEIAADKLVAAATGQFEWPWPDDVDDWPTKADFDRVVSQARPTLLPELTKSYPSLRECLDAENYDSLITELQEASVPWLKPDSPLREMQFMLRYSGPDVNEEALVNNTFLELDYPDPHGLRVMRVLMPVRLDDLQQAPRWKHSLRLQPPSVQALIAGVPHDIKVPEEAQR